MTEAKYLPDEEGSLESKIVELADSGVLDEAARRAIEEQKSKGLPVTYKEGDKVIREHPDGRKEEVGEISPLASRLSDGPALLRKDPKELRGVVFYFLETGLGPAFAFQDEEFMGIPDDTENCAVCGLMKDYFEEYGNPKGPGEETHLGLKEYCQNGHDWKKLYPNGRWSYDGLHYISTGDYLIVYEKNDPEKVIWEGEVDLVAHSSSELWVSLFYESHPALLRLKGER